MGQALEMCRMCYNQRACFHCEDLHGWIMEHMEPKWISANDKKPEKFGDENDALIPYLVYIPDYGVDIGFYINHLDLWHRKGVLVTVTHWMPLPEPPKEEQDT